MTSKSIIDSRLFIRHDLTPTPKTNLNFSLNPSNKSHFASQILIYDSILIPTLDFGIVPILINWLGLDNFKKLNNSSSIKFIRRNGFIAYVGNRNGISIAKIERGDSKNWQWWQDALSQDDAISIELQLMNSFPNVSPRQRKILVQDIIPNVIHLSYDNDFFIKNIAEESYRDVINSNLLSVIALSLEKNLEEIDLLNLAKPNEAKLLNQGGILTSACDLLLRVAEINYELLMATQADNADLFTSQGAEKILQQKLARAKISKRALDGFIKLLNLTKIPDIRPAIEKGELAMAELLKTRNSSNGKNFREWLREADIKSARDLERAYVATLGQSSLVDSLPIRTMRFAITSIASVINPAVGLGSSVIDSFFLDKWLKGYSPKLFLDELQKLVISKTSHN